MPRLNHFSIVCEDPEKLRQFYSRWFGFEELNRAGESVTITDGYFSVGLLREGSDLAEGSHDLGLRHIGFQVESFGDLEKRLQEFDPSMRLQPQPRGGFAEYRVQDPEGLTIELSEEGWGAKGQQRVPGIRHIASSNPSDPWRVFDFYSRVFGMKDARLTEEERPVHNAMWERATDTQVVSGSEETGPVRRIKWDRATKSVVEVIQEADKIPAGQPRGVPFACDGFLNMAILRTSDWIKPNLNHFGMLVRDSYGLMHQIAAESNMRLDQRPQDRPFAEYRVWDPEGNAIDLSEKKGYKVDVGKIERIED